MSGLLRVCVCVTAVLAGFFSYTSPTVAGRSQTMLRHGGLDVTTKTSHEEEQPAYTCGDGQCQCEGSLADCSSRNLDYIPQLPPEITFLNFSNNFILRRYFNDFFINVTNVVGMDLSMNEIYVDFFRPGQVRPNFTQLYSNSSFLLCSTIENMLNIPTLETLILRNSEVSCQEIDDTGVHQKMPRMQELDLSGLIYRLHEPRYLHKPVAINFQRLSPFIRLRRLHLRGNSIDRETRITINHTHYEALYKLRNLSFVDMSDNYLSCFDLHIVLAIPAVQELVLRHAIHCQRIDFDLRLFPFILRLVTLDLSDNTLSYIRIEQPVIETKDMSSNNSKTLVSYERFPELKVISLQGNVLSEFPDLCSNERPALPSLKEVDMSNNRLTSIPTLKGGSRCFPNVQFCNLRGNMLSFINSASQSFNIDSFEHLETLDVSAQRPAKDVYIKGIRKGFFRNAHLKYLKLNDNFIRFKDKTLVDAECFEGCPNLTHLWLAHNVFKGVSEKRFQQLFSRLANLRKMFLNSTDFSYITAGMFNGLHSLEHLDLSDNSLLLLPDNVFQFLLHLVVINLSFNKITVVQESAFPLATRQRLQHIDLSANPFLCSCDVLWFQNWFLKHPYLFSDSLSDYACGNLLDTPIQSFFIIEQACLLSQQSSKFIIATVSLIFLGMSLLSFLYRYRWHIRLVLFEAFWGSVERQRRLQEQEFKYDVFVSYDSDDSRWVHDDLIVNLERGMGLKLCLHQRDFIPGMPIVRNITESLETSKKMLILFSKTFAESQWCQFELELCLTHAMDTQDRLIVVMLENIPQRYLTPSMRALMKTTTYIEWVSDEDNDARISFWSRMRLALSEVLQDA